MSPSFREEFELRVLNGARAYSRSRDDPAKFSAEDWFTFLQLMHHIDFVHGAADDIAVRHGAFIDL